MECTSTIPPGSKSIHHQVVARAVRRGLRQPLAPFKPAGEPHPLLGWRCREGSGKAHGYKATVAERFLLLSRALDVL